MTLATVLLIDDEPDILELLEITLNRMGLETFCAENVAQSHHLLETKQFDLCLTDMRLPDGSGLDIIEYAQKHYPAMPIAMITAYGCVNTATAALKAGAFDFITKPVDIQRLRELVNSALKLRDASNQPIEDKNNLLLGNSTEMQQLQQQIIKLARSQAPVYISGESGTGKELVAKQIHLLGSRSEQPFVPVNCGAIPAELMESEFFGHQKGSFTGAHSNKQGLFQAAQGGTLFLDEVADLPLAMQVKLLRSLQEKTVRPVGSATEVAVDVRILCATHKDLAKEVAAGRFREDLYYRLNVIELNIPPLRKRTGDIALLSQALLQRIAPQNPNLRLSPQALLRLENHDYPGNVRELENMLERACTLCDGNLIEADDLYFNRKSNKTEANAAVETASFSPETSKGDLESQLEEMERHLITQALEATRWNRTAAAEKLGLSLRSMRYRLKKLGID